LKRPYRIARHDAVREKHRIADSAQFTSALFHVTQQQVVWQSRLPVRVRRRFGQLLFVLMSTAKYPALRASLIARRILCALNCPFTIHQGQIVAPVDNMFETAKGFSCAIRFIGYS
jgi:hypothetical protein